MPRQGYVWSLGKTKAVTGETGLINIIRSFWIVCVATMIVPQEGAADWEISAYLRERGGFDTTGEFVWQRGHWSNIVSQKALALAIKADYTFAAWKTRLGVEFDFSSGGEVRKRNNGKADRATLALLPIELAGNLMGERSSTLKRAEKLASQVFQMISTRILALGHA